MSVPGPVLGPCTAWIDEADVAGCCGVNLGDCPSDVINQLEDAALQASMILYEVSGRRFTGLCDPVTVRPSNRCNHWSPAAGLSPYYWTTAWWGGGWYGYWHNEYGDKYGCSPIQKVPLAGYPVREIVEVKIDGNVIPPGGGTVDGVEVGGYRLSRWRELWRLDVPGPPVVRQFWPGCQNQALDDDQPGTFSITYRSGADPPSSGGRAAAELACQIFAACSDAECKLPAGAVRVVREGIEIDRGLLVNWLDPTKQTGLVNLDMFLAAYWRLRPAGRQGAVFSPDLQQFPIRVTS